jgi:hypothetical protein
VLQLYTLGSFGVLFHRPRLARWYCLVPSQLKRVNARPMFSHTDQAFLHVLLQTPGLLTLTVVTDTVPAVDAVEPFGRDHGLEKYSVRDRARPALSHLLTGAPPPAAPEEPLSKFALKLDRLYRLCKEWRTSFESEQQWNVLLLQLLQWIDQARVSCVPAGFRVRLCACMVWLPVVFLFTASCALINSLTACCYTRVTHSIAFTIHHVSCCACASHLGAV